MGAIDKPTLLKIFRNMVRLRFLDDKINELVAGGIGITQHSTRGQEATTVAACAALEPKDYVMPYHRGWGWAIGKGMDPKILLAEVMGKKSGCCGGKGGVHIADWDLRIMGRPGVQAAHVPIAAGVGLSIKFQKTRDVVLCFFGDGASNEGNVHEGMNLASVWKAPVIFICENNLYALFTPNVETTSVRDIADRAKGYAMPGVIVDGNDAVAVYEAASMAIQRARAGEGPTLIESKTYRMHGHTAMDRFHVGGYRPKEEVDEWSKRDPVRRLRDRILESGTAAEAEVVEIEMRAKEEIEAAEKFARESPYPDVDELFRGVYAEEEVQ
ncbi:MAG TPA: thiamine pyrophosphate-dependent dehydrogenase E1 component subunit alpha [Thermodesulfobacteriota bacterium]|nr:thiamine pyrophosphate-dependent dehydrogenase E1 component subunit alpha [Thermodesulfobacteriota bacterium]